MTWSDGFTSSLKEGVLRIFIGLKNELPSAGFEPMNLELNGKHAASLFTAELLLM